MTQNFHPAHESYQTRAEFDNRRNLWYISSTQIFAERWIPDSIMDVLRTTSDKPLDRIVEDIGLDGQLVYYNPERLSGYYPSEKYLGYAGDWNIPFIMRVLFLDNWEYFLLALSNAKGIEFSQSATCCVCQEDVFHIGVINPPCRITQGFYMCKNSTKDNYHVLCHDCFHTQMIDRGLRFTRNPSCPACRTEPDCWLGFTRHPDFDVHEFPPMWMKQFYQQVKTAIFQDEARVFSDAYKVIMDKLTKTREERDRLEEDIKREVAARLEAEKQSAHWQEQNRMNDCSREGWKRKYQRTREAWLETFDEIYSLRSQLLQYRIREREQEEPVSVPAILQRSPTKRKLDKSEQTIEKKFAPDNDDEENN